MGSSSEKFLKDHTGGQVAAILHKVSGGDPEKLDALLRDEFEVQLVERILKLVDKNGRVIPKNLKNAVCDPNKDFYLVQPQLGDKNDYVNRFSRFLEAFNFNTCSFMKPAEFEFRSRELIAEIRQDKNLVNLLNGVYLPIVLPKLENFTDYGETLEKVFLPAIKSSYEKEFPGRKFYIMALAGLFSLFRGGWCWDLLLRQGPSGPCGRQRFFRHAVFGECLRFCPLSSKGDVIIFASPFIFSNFYYDQSISMKNQELAKIFYEIAQYLAMDDVPFKPYAYEKAALTIEALENDIAEIYQKGGKKALEELPGVGKNIAAHIAEYLETGKIKYYDDLKRKTPINFQELSAVEGVGPKRAKTLFQKLNIKNLKDLEKAAKAHKIALLFGFGDKTEKNILEGIKFLKRSKGRFLLHEILPEARQVCEKLKALEGVEKVDYCGSLRRMKETIGDVDFLVIAKNPSKVMDFFVSLPGVVKIWGKGTTKASVRMKGGFDMDIRVVPKKSYGAALQYFTGSKEHNIATRLVAMEKGLKLSEYGLFRGPKMIASITEEDVYRALGMQWIPPEMRENRGEIEASLANKIPEIINYNDLRGDLHVHSDWDGGTNSIKDIAEAAIKMDYEYVGIADHTKFLRIEHGLNEKQLEKRNKEIDKLNWKLKIGNCRLRILKGCEANILKDGSIDIKNEALKKLDYVIAGIHSNFKMPKDQMTERMIRAMKNPNVDIISHPTGRILKKRDEYQIDFDKVLKTAKETGTILEISAWPERLDLNDQNIFKAKAAGVKMVVNTDAHHKSQLKLMEFGIAQARRGWAEKKDVINCRSLKKMLTFLK